MGTVSDKLTYLNGTKQLLKTVINYADAGIDNNTTFRNYAVKLYDAYVEILKDKYVLLDEMPKGTQTGTQISITNAVDLPVYELKASKESTQANSILPSGYTQVDYIQSSGTQYINTGVAPSSITPIIKIQFMLTSTNSGGIFGVYGANDKRFQIYDSSIGIGTYVSKTWNQNSIYIVTLNGKDASATINGITETAGYTNANGFSTDSMYIFTRNDSGIADNGVSQRVYYVKIWDNTTLVRNFIPCYRNNDNEIGLYDLVNNVFYTNQGTGVFTYGSVVSIPNPDYPQEVKTVKGYSNLFSPNISDYTNVGLYKLRDLGVEDELLNMNFIDKDTSIDISDLSIGFSYDTNPNNGYIWSISNGNINANSSNITTSGTNRGVKASYVVIYPNTEDAFNRLNARYYIQIVKGSEVKPYVPYGSNYVDVNISDGTNTNQIPIPLNNNEIAGIGNYLDELIVDKTGHVYLNKKTGKVVLNGTESNYEVFLSNVSKTIFSYSISNIEEYSSIYYNEKPRLLSNYFYSIEQSATWPIGSMSRRYQERQKIYFTMNPDLTVENFKTWLSTHNTEVYYVLEAENLIDLNTTVDIELFKGTNNITNSEGANMRIRYVQDISDLL